MATQALTDADFTDAPATPAPAAKPLSDSDFAESGESSLSAPPVPQATTLVADKNVVLGHPADMSHDQVNDAVQTQVYGKPRIDMHQNAPLAPVLFKAFNRVLMGSGINAFTTIPPEDAKNIAPETGKAILRGVENIGVGFAGLSKWFGETLGHEAGPDIAEEPAWVQSIGKHVADVSQSAINWLHEREQKGFEAPDPEIFRGSFTSNPSYSRLAASVAQGIPALGAAAAVTIATANPIAGAGALGLMSAGEQYEASREGGTGKGQASGAAALSGVGNTLLMSLPLGHYLEGMSGIARGAAEFGGVSAIMTPFNNIVAKLGGDKSRQLFEGMTESILSGAVSGGILGGFSPGRGAEIDGLVQDAHKAGVPAKDIDAARAEIARQMTSNPEAVMGAVDQAKFNQESLGRMKEAGQIVQDNPELKPAARAVYDDIKTKLEAIPRPEGIPETAWPAQIDHAAKLWAAHAVTEAKRRGIQVEDVYRGMRPQIQAEFSGTRPDQEQTTPQPTAQSPAAQAGSSAENEAHLRIFPPTKVSSSESISQHPDFIKMSRDAAAVVSEYAKARGIKPSNEFADSLFREFHDKLGEIMKAQTPEERLAVAERIKAEHPDIENEFSVLRDKLWSDTNEGYFQRSVADKYGSMRPQKGINAENVPQRAKSKPIKYDETGLPERRPGSVISTVTTADGETVKITHEMVLGQAAGLLQDAQQTRVPSPLEKFALDNPIKSYAGKAEAEEFKDVPVRFKNKNGATVDERAQQAYDAGLIDAPSGDAYRNALKDIPVRGKNPKLADFYDEAQNQLEHDFSNYQAESPEVEVEPGVFFQENLFNSPKENLAQTYERLHQQGLDQGLNPSEAAKWAKENLPREQKAIAEQKPKQTEFGAGGVQGFGQGREGEQELFQGGKNPRGSAKFGPEGVVINLMKNADASTFLHESAHVWLRDMHDFIKSGKADETYKADWKLLTDWIGAKEDAKTLSVPQQERFARGFEAYLREGKSPAPGLEGVFSRLKEWLTQVYKSAKALRVDLSDDVRGVMDRMLATPETQEAEPPNKYVRNEPFNARFGETDKMTSEDLRQQFIGIKNAQVVRGGQLADEIRRLVPSKADREGMFWYKAADGDMNVLADALNDPKLEKYHEQIMRAIALPENAREALKKVDQYYSEAGKVSQEIGTIKSVRENYQNRIYEPEPPQDFVKNETKRGLKQSTSHALQRVFDTEFEAAQAGKTFATTDVADALSIHNEEMARVNTSRAMADSMVESGLGAWKKEVPEGWAQVGQLEKRVPIKDKNGEAVLDEKGDQVISHSKFVAPEGIAKGLSAITDPNYVKKIDALRNLQKYQGLAKTLNLSFSFFHHISEAAVTLYQGGVRALMNVGTMDKTLGSEDFKNIEQDFAKHTGMTAMIDTNMDILRNLVENKQDWFSRITNVKGVKQILETADKGGNFLFGKLQRYIKVTDYGRKVANWLADNPEATNAEVKAAKIGFAKEINAAYGGLNWEALGMNKSNLSLLRLGLLAPDWTLSNGLLLKYAVGDTGTAGKAARSHILTALVGGMVLTEGINKMLTGHFTDENKEGHKLEIEIAPNVYVSLLRGGIGDISKLYSMIQDSGAKGALRFAQGKLAPIPRGALTALSGIEYTGRSIYKPHTEHPAIGNTYDFLKAMLTNMSPLPFGLTNFLQYTQEPQKTIPAGIGVATGVARYSKSGRKSSTYKM